jgi:hypothetical protein
MRKAAPKLGLDRDGFLGAAGRYRLETWRDRDSTPGRPRRLRRAFILLDPTAAHRLRCPLSPAHALRRSAADARQGGLMSHSANFSGLWRHAAGYVDRILKGARPSELPIKQSMDFLLLINLKTAKALGLAIPQSLLLRADEVIQ